MPTHYSGVASFVRLFMYMYSLAGIRPRRPAPQAQRAAGNIRVWFPVCPSGGPGNEARATGPELRGCPRSEVSMLKSIGTFCFVRSTEVVRFSE